MKKDNINANYLIKGIIFACFIIIIINQVVAFTGSGTGIKGDPYQITTIEQLNETRDNLTASYILMNDLNFSNASSYSNSGNIAEFTTGVGWIPIGKIGDYTFGGNFNGSGNTISNLYQNNISQRYLGFFRGLNSNSSTNQLNLNSINITGLDYAGGLAGFSYGNISKVSTEGTVSTYDGVVGGIIGYLSGGLIEKSYSDVYVRGEDYVGGLIGYMAGDPIINNSYSSGEVLADWLSETSNPHAGGLVGYVGYRIHNTCTIDNSFATGKVSDVGDTSAWLGGLIGIGNSNVSLVTNSFYDNQTTEQSSSQGGTAKTTAQMKDITTFSAWNILNVNVEERNESAIWNIIDDTIYPFLSWATVTQDFVSLNSPANDFFVSKTFIEVSGIILDSESVGVKNVSILINGVINQTNSTGLEGTYSFNLTRLITGTYNWTIISYDNSNLLHITDNRTLNVYVFTGSGTGIEGDPYQITSWEQLNEIRNDEEFNYYILMNNLTSLTPGYDTYASNSANSGKGWIPIGTSSNKFKGDFNGKDNYLKEIFINRKEESVIGLFSFTENSEISNLNLDSINMTGDNYIGGIIGYSKNSNLSKIFVNGSLYGNDAIGGIIGYSDSDIIKYSDTYIKIYCNVSSGTGCGGLIGDSSSSWINNSYSLGTIEGYQYLGGLIGDGIGLNIYNSYSGINVNSSVLFNHPYVGGLGGNFQFSNILKSYSYGIINYISTAIITVGGLIGLADSSTDVNNSFWDTQTSGQIDSYGGTGKTTAQMKSESTFTDLGNSGLDESWDFLYNLNDDGANLEYWNIDSSINQGYPYLLKDGEITVDLASPLNGSSSSSINSFNCSARTSNNRSLVNSTFYLWDSSGSLINESNTNITEIYNYTLIENITFTSSETYYWNCLVYNELNESYFSDENNSLEVDITNPSINLASPSDGSIIGSSSVTFSYTAQHSTKDLDTCLLYSNSNGIWEIKDSDNSISEIGINSFVDTLDDGSYTWNVWCNTTGGGSSYALNNYTFSIDTSIQSGGGGATVLVVGNPNHTIETLSGGKELNVLISQDSVKPREKQFLLQNNGLEPVTVKIFCSTDNISEETQDIDVCQYVSFDKETYILPANSQQNILRKVYIDSIPGSKNKDIYYFNIIAQSEEGYDSISVSAQVSWTANFYKYSYFPLQKNIQENEKASYPVALGSLILSIIISVLSVLFFRKIDYGATGFFVTIALFVCSFIILVLML